MNVRKVTAGKRRAPGRRRAPAPALTSVRPAARSASRTRSAGLVGLVLATILVAVGGYTVSSRVAAERQELAGLERNNRALARQVAALETELRVRMRLPQLQRWNDEVMRLQPASASQILGSSVELALFAAPTPPPMQVAPRLAAMEVPAAGPPLRALPRPSAPAPPAPRLAVASAPSPLPPAPAPAPAAPEPAPPGLVLASVEAVLDAAPAAAMPGSVPAGQADAPLP